MRNEVGLCQKLTFEGVCEAVFMRQLVEELRPWVGVAGWTSDTTEFLGRLEEVGARPLVRKKDQGLEACVFYFEGSLALLQAWRGEVLLRVGGDEASSCVVEALVKRLLPEANDDGRVRLTFWYWSNVRGHAKRTSRLLEVPRFQEIAGNYPSETLGSLEKLVMGHEQRAGQIMLWFGEPGSGKTYALRSLLREWKGRFSPHYISDAERFFANSDYMLAVLLDEEEEDREKLLILEDAGEFLLPDARQQMGQGLSRLLNASDGLIGQGLKRMFLITTNEPVGRLHPAVSRPGRCAAQIEFDAFTRQEASAWLKKKGHVVDDLADELPLADLYALVRREHPETRGIRVGF